MGRRKIEIPVGTRFGMLKTISQTYTVEYCGQPQSFVKAECDCGNVLEVRTHGIRNQGQISCGCQAWRKGRPSPLRKSSEHHAQQRLVYLEQHRQWMKDHPEAKRTYKARRRQRSREGMDKLDIALSIMYRHAIRNDLCFYCGAPGEHDEHFFPLAKGGTDHWWNLVRACSSCNHRKRSHCGTWFHLMLGS